MSTFVKSLQRRRPNDDSVAAPLPTLEHQYLWHRLSTYAWRSVALVPCDSGAQLGGLAERLAEVAASQPHARVLVVHASLRHCLPPRVRPLARDPSLGALIEQMAYSVGPRCDVLDFGKLHLDDAGRALALAPQLLDYLAAEGRTYSASIFWVDSPAAEPRTIPLVRALDAAVLCVALGRTPFALARQIVEMLGRHKVIGSIALR